MASQNHRMVEVGRKPWRSPGPPLCSKRTYEDSSILKCNSEQAVAFSITQKKYCFPQPLLLALHFIAGVSAYTVHLHWESEYPLKHPIPCI